MVRDIIDIYNRNVITILILSLVLVFPVTFFVYFASIYLYQADSIEYANLPVLYLLVLNFTVLFPPFFSLAQNDLNDRLYKKRKLIMIFINKFGYITFLTLAFFFIGIFGSFFFFIPTFIAGCLMLLFPLFSDEGKVGISIRKTWTIFKKEHIFILLDILLLISLNVLAWAGATYLVANFENNTMVYILLRAIINSIIFPLVYFYLTIKYRKDSNFYIQEKDYV
ncbi:hypothetical protein C0966_15980 [Bacillus methanolicus]|uniref:hypothetical protein n=1 Tax=Bacillus methanolicus TaxID=1471 RepID=UPI002380699E|nr:hypothetical protein [Bacillus methanolicus]MDE3840774.1 hypothetical protein [Bacillus methanolicus]